MSQDKVPYEPKENFGFELDYTFKTRSAPSIDKVSFVESNAPRGSQVLPYLKIKFDFSDFEIRYYRLKVYNNVGIVIKNRKIKRPVSYTLDMGFSDDLKDRVTSHKYSIYFYEKSKQPISKIDIEVAENGDLFLNGEFHGRI
ncbi:MAG: hypothetical protein AAF519_02530 [Bacteroidota bacterium]